MRHSEIKQQGNRKEISLSNEIIDPQKEIKLLKRKLKESRKKYSIEKKRSEALNNDNYVLFKKNSELQEINKVERATRKSYQEPDAMLQESYAMLLNTMKISSRNYCDIILESNNIFPCTITDIEFHKAELEKMMNILSSLIEKDDLLASHRINELLRNQN